MVLEIPLRRFMRSINSRYIYGRVPLVHLIISLIELAMIGRLAAKFNGYYADRPGALLHLRDVPMDDECILIALAVLTMMITNALLGGIADTVAQSITAIRQAAIRKPGGITKDDTLAIEIHDLDRKGTLNDHDLIPASKILPPPFDFERLTRFMAYGFIMAPVQFKWFQFLSRAFPITKTSALGRALKMVAMDQLVFAPVGIATFFTVMTVAEGGGRRAVSHKLRDMYLPTLKANFMLWPLVQIINFRIMPLQFQLPFVSTVGIAWGAYLSLSNAAEDAMEDRSAPPSPNIRLL
ncbi:Mpv17/PMP22 family protein [Drepanopeziza brunnea f. sp. 'multigermtubi' MB_m1]|uniref:Mpv17/PMP22 family protein n=1 Tax=Marssonina brunnea f. sp. multigermtubi (strain MB_m1) TaxID=1072389 RepID=K1WTN2_MARBU|nr:Mpv17/PMP22 family protein [Drepanopeziza brunnea f. sp. 'multigermtubi' MB_m1]EKD15807.1 Mpv17/PMP22 family protein [Drepanopeziza brunnea f. sp. 'multigermtubi' MB_m1]